jgi:anti-sigma factor RsiW
MNAETLERLLIDRASGELPPDTSELLEAYLQATPQNAAAADAIKETLLLAKKSLTPSSTPALPPPDFVRPTIFSVPANSPNWRFAQWAYGMAACFIGGLVLGWFVTRAPVQPPQRAPIVINQPASQPVAVASGFWSASRLYQAASTAPAVSTRSRIFWESPVRQPQIN